VTSPAMTQAGVILGTAASMPPEQARGKPLDRRADIWAFGVVLLEMLTGRRVFAGDNVVEVLGRVLNTEPDWKGLPPDTPRAVQRLLRWTFKKDPRQGLADIRDARLEIEEAAHEAEHAAVSLAPRPRSRSLWLASLVALTALIAALAIPTVPSARRRACTTT